jgi:hypothetical protein
LPKKFGIDKRRGHLSDLINSGQITRDEALLQMGTIAYDEKLFRQDLDFVIKKFELDNTSFECIMNSPTKTFKDYPNNFEKVRLLKILLNKLREKGFYSK